MWCQCCVQCNCNVPSNYKFCRCQCLLSPFCFGLEIWFTMGHTWWKSSPLRQLKIESNKLIYMTDKESPYSLWCKMCHTISTGNSDCRVGLTIDALLSINCMTYCKSSTGTGLSFTHNCHRPINGVKVPDIRCHVFVLEAVGLSKFRVIRTSALPIMIVHFATTCQCIALVSLSNFRVYSGLVRGLIPYRQKSNWEAERLWHTSTSWLNQNCSFPPWDIRTSGSTL